MAIAIFCRLLPVAAQTNQASPLTPSMGMRNLLSIRLDDPVILVPGKVLLKWELATAKRGGYANVERATFKDGPFEVLAVIRQDSVLAKFTDEQPMKGKNFYRLNWMLEDGTRFVSNTVQANLAGDMTCRFYPNPVDNVLIVRSEQALDLVLSDANGKIMVSLKLQPGLQTVDVSKLDKGLYIITLTQMESGRVITEKLMKN
ncbi:T9SS type A sorting domain-containing protein [Flavihumibacter sp. UBA7668]|uniref:T9SS type A sorting domain-containing protein n=1 Tax=Flavihumibacter sp. UBA7668 TaxID=1946542 RepID=UPI0025BF0A74|nr:T9SS type A sorting domain-containing protein [Flavihumibacter sp. UBA7668]